MSKARKAEEDAKVFEALIPHCLVPQSANELAAAARHYREMSDWYLLKALKARVRSWAVS